MNRIRVFAVLIMSLAAACQTLPAPDVTLRDPGKVDQVIDGYVESGAFPFVYARLEDRYGRVVYEHAAVNDGLLPETAITADTWIRIWSMSKIVTIATVLDLVEDGVLGLDDPVTLYIPEFAGLRVAVANDGSDLATIEDKQTACPLDTVPVDSEMTILHLVNHEAGFYYATTDIPCLDELIAASDLPRARESNELVGLLAALPLIQQPGTRDYYGTNTTVLGLVAERATGQSLRELVEQRVTGPLSIEGLRYDLPRGAGLLPRFSGRDGELREANPGELDIFGGHVPDYGAERQLFLGGEGMLATADGYADFLRMLLAQGSLNGYRALEAATVQDIVSPHTQLDSPYGYNGYNLWVSNGYSDDGVQDPAPLWIGGGYEGTHFWIDPERQIVGVIMSQIFWVPESGWHRDRDIRRAIYEQIGD